MPEDETQFTPKEEPVKPASTVTTSTKIETVQVGKPRPNESMLFYVSMRAWIALLVVGTVCLMSFKQLEVKEPLYTLAGLVVGFFFGQAKSKQPQSAQG